jgi:hypothetical protein
VLGFLDHRLAALRLVSMPSLKAAVLGHRPVVRHRRRRSGQDRSSDEIGVVGKAAQHAGNQRLNRASLPPWPISPTAFGPVKNMRSEQQIMRDWVEAQSDEQRRCKPAGKDRRRPKKTGVH